MLCTLCLLVCVCVLSAPRKYSSIHTPPPHIAGPFVPHTANVPALCRLIICALYLCVVFALCYMYGGGTVGGVGVA